MRRFSSRFVSVWAGVLITSLVTGGCAFFPRDDEDPLPPPAPSRPTTVPVQVDTSTPSGLFQEMFVEFPRRVMELASGKTPVNAAVLMESNFADQRRAGINDLVDRSFGKQAPYTDRYQQIAEFDQDPTVRASAIRALNRSRDDRATGTFIQALSDENWIVRLEAAKALSNVPDPRAVGPLLKVLNNPSEQTDVKIAVAEAVRHYRSMEVARALVDQLNGPDFGLAWQARQSLRFMTGADQKYDQSAWLNYLTGPQNPLG
ncbi:MAG: hypothetical protein KatS3mg104_1730 [Phycisphaerae bacterium]|nr:MAG: hypothetical protein KatS3mg104_1730 [Phycisphaerae bacterium]